MDEAKTPEPTRQRLAQTLIVPILLLAALGGWFWLGQQAAPGAPATIVAARPSAAAATTAPPDAAQLPAPTAAALLVGPATPWGAAGLEPTATAEPSAVVAPGTIDVYGPPAGSRFRAADEVVFYWSWPDDLAEGQHFVLYLIAADGRQALGQVAEVNLGSRRSEVFALVPVALDASGHELAWIAHPENTRVNLSCGNMASVFAIDASGNITIANEAERLAYQRERHC